MDLLYCYICNSSQQIYFIVESTIYHSESIHYWIYNLSQWIYFIVECTIYYSGSTLLLNLIYFAKSKSECGSTLLNLQLCTVVLLYCWIYNLSQWIYFIVESTTHHSGSTLLLNLQFITVNLFIIESTTYHSRSTLLLNLKGYYTLLVFAYSYWRNKLNLFTFNSFTDMTDGR